MTVSAAIPTHWISDPATLSELLIAARPSRIGIDTEFIRERTYWPKLALVQIALDDRILLVDPLAAGMCTALVPVLTDRSIVKVMHSASEDLVALKHACGVVPQPLFDTQIAAALASIGAGVGYQRLVQEQLHIALQKGETRSDWLRRPLSESQLAYAADDVQYLFELHDILTASLSVLGRTAWLEEDCARLISNAEQDQAERWPHLALRSAQYLDIDAQRRLLRLLRWRDTYARENDRPRTWILDNELAITIAREPPSDPYALRMLLDTQPRAPKGLAETVWIAMTTALPDESESPEMRAAEPDKQFVRQLQDAVSAHSVLLGLPDGVLASKRWLELWAEHRSAGHDSWPGPLAGWRRTQLEIAFAPVVGVAVTGGD